MIEFLTHALFGFVCFITGAVAMGLRLVKYGWTPPHDYSWTCEVEECGFQCSANDAIVCDHLITNHKRVHGQV